MEVWVSGRNQFTANADSPGFKGLNFSRVKLIIWQTLAYAQE